VYSVSIFSLVADHYSIGRGDDDKEIGAAFNRVSASGDLTTEKAATFSTKYYFIGDHEVVPGPTEAQYSRGQLRSDCQVLNPSF
jgi:hypothetical protein